MDNLALTQRQQEILQFVVDTVAREQIPPSWQEIAAAFGIASTRAVQKHLLLLQDKGYLELRSGQRRGIHLTALAQQFLPAADADFLSLPILGRVAAGAPIGADPQRDQARSSRVKLDAALFKPKPDYLLRVKGDSMRDEGILDGDLVAIQQASQARNGAIVVARIEDEITIKKLQLGDGQVSLLARNPNYAPIVVDASQSFAIIGLYCGLLRRGGY